MLYIHVSYFILAESRGILNKAKIITSLLGIPTFERVWSSVSALSTEIAFKMKFHPDSLC